MRRLLITVAIIANTASVLVAPAAWGAGSDATVGAPTSVGSASAGVAFTPDGATAYVVNRDSRSVSVIDVGEGTVASTIDLEYSPSSVAVSPDGERAYVTTDSQFVLVVGVSSGALGDAINVDQPSSFVVFSPDGTQAYVAHPGVRQLSVIDVVAGQFTGMILLGADEPWQIAFSPDALTAHAPASAPVPDSSRAEGPVSVSASVSAGGLSVSVSEAAFPSVMFSHAAQSTSADAVLAVDDLTGVEAGWSVTLVSSSLVWTGRSGEFNASNDLPAANLSVGPVTGVRLVAGQVFDGSVLGRVSALDSAVGVLSAVAGQGSGSYAVPLTMNLAIPGNAPTGTYSGTLTTTIAAAP